MESVIDEKTYSDLEDPKAKISMNLIKSPSSDHLGSDIYYLVHFWYTMFLCNLIDPRITGIDTPL